MAVPSYDDLLARQNVDSTLMELTFEDDHLRELASNLESCEILGIYLEIPDTDIKNIMSHGEVEVQKIRLRKCWKQRCGSTATYKAMVNVLLQIKRTDLAEKVIALRQTLRDTSQSPPSSPCETNPATPTSPASSSGIEDMPSPAASYPSSLLATPIVQTQQDVTPILEELEEEFYQVVKNIESTLKINEVQVNTLTSRFRMLPQHIKRRHQTDENYAATRQKILDSTTTKELFDNLTVLKHWSYMMPETLVHILRDVKIDDIHQIIDKYTQRLKFFKENTKLRELIGAEFPVPDYCMELTMEVEGWEDRTIQEVENKAKILMQRAVYNGQAVGLGWKRVNTGSITLTFIFMESVKLNVNIEKLAKVLKDEGVVSIHVDGENLLSNDQTEATASNKKVPTSLWYRTGTKKKYRDHAPCGDRTVGGGRDVLIIAPDLSLPNPEAVARRPGQLTKEDKLKLQNQGLPPDCHNELDITKARYELDKGCNIVETKSGKSLSQDEIIQNIGYLLNTTQNDGVVLYYDIGAGRRGTGDWCFEDGFITFRDIAQLYLRASHNFKGRVLTIDSDCSYSGCWVRDCMEFLDEQGVQPCGHKAREKGMIIKVYSSCKSNEIPTEYHFSVSGVSNDKNTGTMIFGYQNNF